MPPKKAQAKPAKAEPRPVIKPEVKPEPISIMEASTVSEEFVSIFVPEENGTATLEVAINEKVWRLARGEWAHDVPAEVARVIQRSIKADRDQKRMLKRMQITPSNPYGQAVQA